MAPANWGSAPGMGKDQIPLGSRQVPLFRKSDGPHARITASTTLPSHSWKGNLCSAPDIGPTAKRVSICAAASSWLLYKTASVCQSWAAAAEVAEVLPAGWAPPGPNPYGGTGEPCTRLQLSGVTREPHHPHPQGVPKDVREPAWTKGPGAAGGQVPLPRGTQPSPVCVSPSGHPAKALPL